MFSVLFYLQTILQLFDIVTIFKFRFFYTTSILRLPSNNIRKEIAKLLRKGIARRSNFPKNIGITVFAEILRRNCYKNVACM